MNRYSSRKFMVALLALGLVTWMRFSNVLADESTATVMVAAILGYTGGNVAQKWSKDKEVA